MGSRSGTDSVARARKEPAAGLVLATGEIPMPDCSLPAKEQPKSHLKMVLKY